MNRIAFDDDDPCFNEEVRLLGVGREETMPPGFVSRRQGLPAFLLVLFHDAAVAEVRGRRRSLEPGTMVFWDRDRPHLFGHATCPWSHSWVVFSGRAWNDDHAWWNPLFEAPQRVQRDGFLVDGFGRLLREFIDMDRPSLPILADNIRLLLRELDREQGLATETGATADPLRAAGRWIGAHLNQRITVADVARRAGLSPSRVQQLFHARYGCSVQVWVERQRMQEVRYWLMHSGLNIGQIAARTGFADGFYLSRRFSKAFGMSPTAYRRKHFGEAPSGDPLPRHN